MKRCAPLAIVASLFASVVAAQAQPITIKLKERGEGETALIKKNATTTSKVMVADGQGNVVVDQKQLVTELTEYKETVFKRDAGKAPTKLQREYTKARTGKDSPLQDTDLQGKTVVIERKGDKYVFTYKDGEPV
jgi:hypothetical protein